MIVNVYHYHLLFSDFQGENGMTLLDMFKMLGNAQNACRVHVCKYPCNIYICIYCNKSVSAIEVNLVNDRYIKLK